MIYKFKTSLSPFIGTKEKVSTVMLDVIISLLPICLMAIYYYRLRALMVFGISITAALFTEFLCNKIMKTRLTIFDGSALVTAVLFALIIPPYILWWQIFIGAGISILLGKMVYGGLGQNIFNPALIGLAFLMNSWPEQMTKWGFQQTDSIAGSSSLATLELGIKNIDGFTGATPLELLKFQGYDAVLNNFGGRFKLLSSLFWGNYAGTLGEVSIFALFLGIIYLFIKKQISWYTPISYVMTVFVLYYFMGQDPLFQIMTGGLILGAFFMATDMVTTPFTSKGRLIFGIGAGLITVLVRTKGGYYEGVCYSILFMNALTPLINSLVKIRVFGGKK